MRKQKGITLIALVITIIVLLILAAVSISTIMGDDGLLARARNAKSQTEIGTEKEQINLSYSSCKLDKDKDIDAPGDNVTASDLQNKMNQSYGAGTVEVTGNNLLKVKYLKSNRSYLVLANGASVNYDELLENAVGKEAIGIAEDGTLVDMSNWVFVLEFMVEDTGYRLGFEGTAYDGGYIGDIVDGKIVGEVPMYIYEDLDGIDEDLDIEDFKLVVSLAGTFSDQYDLVYPPEIPSSVCIMRNTFFGCENLIEAPEIPDGVIDMEGCFSYCESLVEAPEIPDGVIDIAGWFAGCTSLKIAPEIPERVTNIANCFSGCESLVEAPEIPDGVIDMEGCFSYCESLVEAPSIPASVRDMRYCFRECKSLTGNLKIDANLEDDNYYGYSYCFKDAAINEGCELILTGSSLMLNELVATKSENSNIRVGN